MKLVVEGQKIYSFDSPPIKLVEGSSEFVPIELQCSSEWDELLITVQFIQQGKTISKYIGEARTLNVPADIDAGWLMITCFGAKTDTEVFGTVNGYEIEVYPAGLSSTKQEPIPPTPNLYNQLVTEVKKYADEAQESADKVEEAQQTAQEAKDIADTIQANAEAGLYNGKDGINGTNAVTDSELDVNSNNAISNSAVSTAIGEIVEQLKNGIITDYWKLENSPFQPVPDAPNPPDLLRVPQNLDKGAYVFVKDDHIFFNGESYYPSKSDLLFVNGNTAVMLSGNDIMITKKNDDGYMNIGNDTSYLLNDFEQIYQAINLLTEWFMPLFNVSPGQAVTVENADMANLTLELGGMDMPITLPNPNALTIKIGDESVVYDGSSAQTIEIADGNEVAY